MKTTLALSFLAALVAFALSLINIEVAATLMCAAGLLGVMNADYSRRSSLLVPRVEPLAELPTASYELPAMSFEPAA